MKEITPYITEKLKRTKIRKTARKEKRKARKEIYKILNKYQCRGCGDGTPYSY